MRQGFVCGDSADAHLEMIDRYAKAGFDEVYVGNAGPHWQGLFDLYQREVLPTCAEPARPDRPRITGTR